MIELTAPIRIMRQSTFEDIIDLAHENFKAMTRLGNKPNIHEIPLYIRLNWINRKAETFWHCSSFDKTHKFSILPCNNDRCGIICNQNCISWKNVITLESGERAICPYRATRVHWIAEIIKLYNANDPRIGYSEVNQSSKSKGRVEAYLRYFDSVIDYVIVMEKKESQYSLLTAYPVFFLNEKKILEKQISEFQANKSR